MLAKAQPLDASPGPSGEPMTARDIVAIAKQLKAQGKSDKQIACHLNSTRSAGERHLSAQDARDLYQGEFRKHRNPDEQRRSA
jgi:hypothetical protein